MGNAAHYARPQAYFRVISKNVSTINPQMLDMMAIATELPHFDASVFLAQRTNMAWKPSILHTIHTQSTCPLTSQTCYILKHQSQWQPLSTWKNSYPSPWQMASQVIKWGLGELLGWWSYIKLVNQHGKHLIIASTYHVCPQQFDMTTNTDMAQQTHLLLKQGIPKPMQAIPHWPYHTSAAMAPTKQRSPHWDRC